jgi:hypothetical protein
MGSGHLDLVRDVMGIRLLASPGATPLSVFVPGSRKPEWHSANSAACERRRSQASKRRFHPNNEPCAHRESAPKDGIKGYLQGHCKHLPSDCQSDSTPNMAAQDIDAAGLLT